MFTPSMLPDTDLDLAIRALGWALQDEGNPTAIAGTYVPVAWSKSGKPPASTHDAWFIGHSEINNATKYSRVAYVYRQPVGRPPYTVVIGEWIGSPAVARYTTVDLEPID